ncbi:MAG TPA: hypothetical protein DF383_01790, partial [Deltaproteobacteria bacterium]|nr:hypothetical protein [Deltaproteobacteria bacterium]
MLFYPAPAQREQGRKILMQDTPQIITKVYDLLLYLIPKISKFPRSQRYLLGERLELCGFEVLELLIEACYSRDKISLLKSANVKLEKARYYVRLCQDLKL